MSDGDLGWVQDELGWVLDDLGWVSDDLGWVLNEFGWVQDNLEWVQDDLGWVYFCYKTVCCLGHSKKYNRKTRACLKNITIVSYRFGIFLHKMESLDY